MLPFVIGAGVGKFVVDMMVADNRNAKAGKINLEAFEKSAEAKLKVNKQSAVTKTALLKLANRKKGILNTSIPDFLNLYNQIMQIDFQPGDGIIELGQLALQPSAIEDMRQGAQAATSNMSTPQVIVTYIFQGITGVIAKEAEIELLNAKMRNEQADVIAEQAETICIALDAIIQRANRISEQLAKMNVFLKKSINYTRVLIEEKGYNRQNYNKTDRESIMACMDFAKGVKVLLDSPLLDRDGRIAEQSMHAIQTGERYLSKINQAM